MRDTNWDLLYFSSFLWGSSFISRSFRQLVHLRCSGKHHQTFPNDSSKLLTSTQVTHTKRKEKKRKRKMGNFAKRLWSQQHPVFPGGHPSKYWLGSMLLNFSDRTRTGVFNMIWPLARVQENVDNLFQQHTYLPTYMIMRYLNSVYKPLLLCFEHFFLCKKYVHSAKIRLRFAIWAFSSQRIQIYVLFDICSAGFQIQKIYFLPNW